MEIHKGFIGIFFVVTIIVILGAFDIIGSPAFRKQIARDRYRLQTFASISYAVDNYYRTHYRLPRDLSDINIQNIIDTQTKKPDLPDIKKDIRYMINADSTGASYFLCANFETPYKEYMKQAQLMFPYEGYPLTGITTLTHTKGDMCINFRISDYVQKEVAPFLVTPTPMMDSPFSGLSASLTMKEAAFTFAHEGKSSQYTVDISIYPNFTDRIYYAFAEGSAIPLKQENVSLYAEYECGRIIYWKAVNDVGISSNIQKATVRCDVDYVPFPNDPPPPAGNKQTMEIPPPHSTIPYVR